LILSDETPLGEAIDLGAYPAGAKLSFALNTDNGYIYYTDQVKNPDFLSHVRKLPIGYNKWELRWEASLGLTKKSYKDLVVAIEVLPIIREDVVLAGNSHVVAKLVSKNTPYHNSFWLCQPERRTLSNSRLVFALQAADGNMYYTDSSLNADGKAHVIKLPLGSSKCQLRWEDRYALKDRDYNDLVVEIIVNRVN
jgi:hypothetical protein